MPSPTPSHLNREVAADSPEAALPLHGPNQWPPPSLLPQLRPTYEAYLAAVTQLGLRLLRLLALALGLPGDTFLPLFGRPMTFLRPLHYSPQVGRSGLLVAVQCGWPSKEAHSNCCHISWIILMLHACGSIRLQVDACSRMRLPGLSTGGTARRCVTCWLCGGDGVQVSAPSEGIFGAGAHTDYGMLTILTTDGTPGLQIHAGGAWLDVPQVEGAFIINLGDMLERWAGGLVWGGGGGGGGEVTGCPGTQEWQRRSHMWLAT
jgi:hypothetical protein